MRGDWPCNQRVGAIGFNTLPIMGEKLRFDVGIDEERAFEFLPERDALFGERHIKLDVEGWRRHDKRTDIGRIVMHPCARQNGADALRNQRHVFVSYAGFGADMGNETVEIADRRTEGRREAAHARRVSVAARIPGIECIIIKAELIHEMAHTSAMLMAAMQENDNALRLFRAGRPETIEQRSAVMGDEMGFLRFTM
ncbi:hypothetical protein FQZ97_942040 [compost metagenome]